MTTKTPKFVFRIRKQYFDWIVTGEKTEEYRRDVRFWQVRLANVLSDWPSGMFFNLGYNFSISTVNRGIQAIFICGKRKHTREVIRIERRVTPEGFSEQGQKDVDTEMCFIFHLGKEIKER